MLQEGKRRKSSDRMSPQLKYAPSKWETVDPNLIEAQAMTTSKWDLLDQQDDDRKSDDEDIDGRPMEDGDGDNSFEKRELMDFEISRTAEERRAKLREIELKVAKFQDELEGGKRTRKADMTVMEQVEHYRQKLLRKEKNREEELDRRKEYRGTPSPDFGYDARKYTRLPENSPSPRKTTRSRSRSPRSSHRSRSRSPRRRQHLQSPGKTPRSRSPKRSRRSPSSPSRRHHSDSRSPIRHLNKSRKSKH